MPSLAKVETPLKLKKAIDDRVSRALERRERIGRSFHLPSLSSASSYSNSATRAPVSQEPARRRIDRDSLYAHDEDRIEATPVKPSGRGLSVRNPRCPTIPEVPIAKPVFEWVLSDFVKLHLEFP